MNEASICMWFAGAGVYFRCGCQLQFYRICEAQAHVRRCRLARRGYWVCDACGVHRFSYSAIQDHCEEKKCSSCHVHHSPPDCKESS